MKFVLFEGEIAWTSGENFCELAARSATKQIHLPQTILRRCIALTEVQILVVFGFNVRNAAFIATDRYLIFKTLDCDRILSRGFRGWDADWGVEANKNENYNSKASHKFVPFVRQRIQDSCETCNPVLESEGQ